MKHILFILLLLLPCLSDSKENPYIALIQQALDKQPALCLGESHWPVVLAQGESLWLHANMAALADAGLITAQVKKSTTQWSLTPMGEKEFKKNGDFCYGTLRVNQIHHVLNTPDRTVAVIFDYQIASLPMWARHPAIRGAYSSLDNLVMGIKSARYQADFLPQASGTLQIIGEPYQLDLFY